MLPVQLDSSNLLDRPSLLLWCKQETTNLLLKLGMGVHGTELNILSSKQKSPPRLYFSVNISLLMLQMIENITINLSTT